VNGVGLFFHTDDHRFAFSTQATDKMYGRVIFELLKVCDCVHVYVNLIAILIFESAMSATEAAPTRGML
jgi:hypothetical protein